MFRLNDLLILLPLALIVRVMAGVLRPTARARFGRVILDAVFLTYVVALIEVVLGFRHLGGLGNGFLPWAHVNLVPLRTISEIARPDRASGALGQVIGNVLLFLPLGVLLPATAAGFRTFGSVLVAGFLISVGIELMQLGLLLSRLMNRAADVDDVILNTIGAVLGYAIWAMLAKGARQAERVRVTMSTMSPEGES